MINAFSRITILLLLLVVVIGCSLRTQSSTQPTPTLVETLSQRDSIRRIRSRVITQVQIVDPFQVTTAQSEEFGDVYTVSYLSPYPFDGEEFEMELKNVALQASEGFVLSELKLPYLLISSTSVDKTAGIRILQIDYESAYQWFTGQIDTKTYQEKWVEIQ